MIADTHVHIWDLTRVDYPWLQGNTTLLNRTYAIEDLEADRTAAGITAGVLVQAANSFEDTDWMLQAAARTTWIKGVVGWLPLADPSATQKALEEKYLREKYFKGVRHLIHDEPDPQWLLQPAVLESLTILASYDIPYDMVGVSPAHIHTILQVAERVPGLRIVLDHLNRPPAATKERFGQWGELMKTAARHPVFYAKISGLGTVMERGDWSADDIRPYIEFVVEHFGTDRCFCGGDWPVSLLGGTYTHTWHVYREIIDKLATGDDREKIYYTNAAKFYSF